MTYDEARAALIALAEADAKCPYAPAQWSSKAKDYEWYPGHVIPCIWHTHRDATQTSIIAVMFLSKRGEPVLWYVGERVDNDDTHYIMEQPPAEWLRYDRSPESRGWRFGRWNIKVGPWDITNWVKEECLL